MRSHGVERSDDQACRSSAGNPPYGDSLTVLLTSIGFGFVTAAIVALAAIGLSLQIGVTNVPNFAHGELITFGAYGALIVQFVTDNVLLDTLGGMALAGVTAWAMNRFVLQSFVKKGAPRIYLLIATAGLSFFLQNLLAFIFGERTQVLQLPSGSSTGYHVGPFLWTGVDLLIMAAAIVAVAALYVVLQFTKFGKAQRAVSNNPELARVSGIPVNRVINLTWLIAGLLAGLAGVAVAGTTGSMVPTIGSDFLLVVFAAAIVGGLGRPYGALIAAVIVGLVTEVSAAYINSAYKTTVAVAILVLAILIRPNGIFTVSREIT
jgi:branched-chain amino acid transport system permease protein